MSDTHKGLQMGPDVNSISPEEPWKWLSAGWRDLRANALYSLTYGAIFSIISGLLVLGLFELELTSLMLALAAGFMLLGPLLAVGLYQASRLLEKGHLFTLSDMVFVKTKSSMQLAYLGVLLMGIFMVCGLTGKWFVLMLRGMLCGRAAAVMILRSWGHL